MPAMIVAIAGGKKVSEADFIWRIQGRQGAEGRPELTGDGRRTVARVWVRRNRQTA